MIMPGRGRASEIIDAADFGIIWEAYVMAHQLEAMIIQEMLDILLVAGDKIVQTQDFPPFADQTVAKMRP